MFLEAPEELVTESFVAEVVAEVIREAERILTDAVFDEIVGGDAGDQGCRTDHGVFPDSVSWRAAIEGPVRRFPRRSGGIRRSPGWSRSPPT
jgi:hypothetical protein